MQHQLTLEVLDVPAAMRTFDLLRRLDVAILGFSASQTEGGFALSLTLRLSGDLAADPDALPERLGGTVGVGRVEIAAMPAGIPARDGFLPAGAALAPSLAPAFRG